MNILTTRRSEQLRPDVVHWVSGSALIHELQRELNIARRPGAGNQAERAALNIRIGKAETRVIREIEKLRSELQLLPLHEPETLVRDEIEAAARA